MANNDGGGGGGGGHAPKIVALPSLFEDGDIEEWIAHVDVCANANHWDDDMKVRAAPAYLRGRAALVYRDFDDGQKDTWDHLKEALIATLAPNTAERRRIARQYLFSRGETLMWDTSEPLQKYVRRITRLVDRGFPELAGDARKNMLIERFTDGLPDEIANELQLHPVPEKTLQATMDRAEELVLHWKRRKAMPQWQVGNRPKAVAAVGIGEASVWDRWEPTTAPPPPPLFEQSLEPTRTEPKKPERRQPERRDRSEDRLASALLKLEERLSRLEAGTPHGSVSAVSHASTTNTRATTSQECFFCHQPGHIVRDCPQAKAARANQPTDASQTDTRTCYRCKQPGHIARYCRAPEPVAQQPEGQPNARSDSRTTMQGQSVNMINPVCHVKGALSSIVAEGKVEDVEAEFLIDTGARPSLCPKSLIKDLSQLREGSHIVTIDNTSIPVVGRLKMLVQLGNWSAEHDFLVTTLDLGGPVLGFDFLSKYEMDVQCRRNESMLVWGKNAVPLSTPPFDEEPCYVALAEDVTVKRDEITVVRATNAKFVENRGVMPARVLVDTEKGTVPVQLVGLYAQDSSERIAELEAQILELQKGRGDEEEIEAMRIELKSREDLIENLRFENERLKEGKSGENEAVEATYRGQLKGLQEDVSSKEKIVEDLKKLVEEVKEEKLSRMDFDTAAEIKTKCAELESRIESQTRLLDQETKRGKELQESVARACEEGEKALKVASLKGKKLVKELQDKIRALESQPSEKVVPATSKGGVAKEKDKDGEKLQSELKRQLASLEDVVELRIAKAQEDQKKAYDARISKTPDYNEGELVWVRSTKIRKGTSKKLALKYEGPYEIVEKMNEMNVKVKKVGGGPLKRIHVNRIKKCYFWPTPTESQRSEQESAIRSREANVSEASSLLRSAIPEDEFTPVYPLIGEDGEEEDVRNPREAVRNEEDEGEVDGVEERGEGELAVGGAEVEAAEIGLAVGRPKRVKRAPVRYGFEEEVDVDGVVEDPSDEEWDL